MSLKNISNCHMCVFICPINTMNDQIQTGDNVRLWSWTYEVNCFQLMMHKRTIRMWEGARLLQEMTQCPCNISHDRILQLQDAHALWFASRTEVLQWQLLSSSSLTEVVQGRQELPFKVHIWTMSFNKTVCVKPNTKRYNIPLSSYILIFRVCLIQMCVT